MNNWEQIGEEFQLRGISGRAFRSENASLNEEFDVGIFLGTFESRGLVSSTLFRDKTCKFSIIGYFEEAKETELRKKYDDQLFAQVEKCSQETKRIDGLHIEFIEDNIENILNNIPRKYWGSTSKWFMDISGMPTPYFLGILGYLRESFPSPRITVFNPTAKYDHTEMSYSFTEGFIKNIWIPRLWGRPDPTLPRTFVFMLGFDGVRSYEVLFTCEPDYVKAVVGSPGYEDDYELKAIENNKMLLLECDLWRDAKTSLIRTNAADPIQTWRELSTVLKKDKLQSNICFVPLGPKAHALGCGLTALSDGISSVLYHMPRAYSVRDVSRGKYLWKYDITL